MTKLRADYIKEAVNPADFYRHELPDARLKQSGWNDGGLCPFHADNKPGSFRVNLQTGAYRCFACDAAGGDVIAFTMALHGLKFVEALAQLARDWGL
ncbi:CHC2 zinc finger domain-containing protein [Methylocucumis oryzae]|uniref:CHC2 zinc finger domain-containing protein n=1 Tax=Methylocucumis oryzae TaxID=1632867 RepID=UPI0006960766|nr:CHC2 zinc finger domain-containing protein [Methylocucumis oryzae]